MNIDVNFFNRYKIILPEQAVNSFLPVNRFTGKKFQNPTFHELCTVLTTSYYNIFVTWSEHELVEEAACCCCWAAAAAAACCKA